MTAYIMLTSTDNLLAYSGQVVHVVPKVKPIKIQFKLNPKKGCGQVGGD